MVLPLGKVMSGRKIVFVSKYFPIRLIVSLGRVPVTAPDMIKRSTKFKSWNIASSMGTHDTVVINGRATAAILMILVVHAIFEMAPFMVHR